MSQQSPEGKQQPTTVINIQLGVSSDEAVHQATVEAEQRRMEMSQTVADIAEPTPEAREKMEAAGIKVPPAPEPVRGPEQVKALVEQLIALLQPTDDDEPFTRTVKAQVKIGLQQSLVFAPIRYLTEHLMGGKSTFGKGGGE